VKAPRDILKHVSVEIAKARRKCYRDRSHQIAKGERCLVIREGSFGGSKNYCSVCAAAILTAAESKQAALRRGIGSRV
jgi:hypothetical protein